MLGDAQEAAAQLERRARLVKEGRLLRVVEVKGQEEVVRLLPPQPPLRPAPRVLRRQEPSQ